VKQRDKENYQKPENQVKKKAYRKKYNSREDIKEKRNLDRRERLKIDAKYAITCRLRCRLNHAITDYTMDGKIKKSRDYEIDYEAIIEHLKPFPKDRKKYHIDHIMPLISFNLNNPDEVKIAFAPMVVS